MVRHFAFRLELPQGLLVQLRGDIDVGATRPKVESHRRPCSGHGLQCLYVDGCQRKVERVRGLDYWTT